MLSLILSKLSFRYLIFNTDTFLGGGGMVYGIPSTLSMGFTSGTVVKNPPDRREMGVRSLCQEDPLVKEMATHSSIVAWRIPWTEELGGLQSMGSQNIGHDPQQIRSMLSKYLTNIICCQKLSSFNSFYHNTCAYILLYLVREP